MQIIRLIFTFLNDQLLKMIWLQDIVNLLLLDVFKLDQNSQLFTSLSFFIYDVIKIFILLMVLIFISSYIQTYFPPERTKKILSKHKGIGSHIFGALLGTITPFCSCSSIPIFIGFTRADLPVGVTFSFLISSPLVDLASILMLASFFGWEIALFYVIVGLVIAVVGGTLISWFGMDKYVEDFIKNSSAIDGDDIISMTKMERVKESWYQVRDIIKRVWLYILIGVGIGAIIHGVIPQAFIERMLGSNNPFSVLIATVLGIPMYADIFGTLPIAEALVGKGVQVGTVLAFMMAVTALSLPSMIMLKKVVKNRLLITFVSIVAVSIVIMGYLFNIII